jgi:hypothetical protein
MSLAGFSRGGAWIRVAQLHVGISAPALKTPHENALVAKLGSAQHTYAPSEVNNCSLTVNGRKWQAIAILEVPPASFWLAAHASVDLVTTTRNNLCNAQIRNLQNTHLQKKPRAKARGEDASLGGYSLNRRSKFA